MARQSTYPDGQSDKYNIFCFVTLFGNVFYNFNFVNKVPLFSKSSNSKTSTKNTKIRKTFIVIINLIRIKILTISKFVLHTYKAMIMEKYI